MRFLNERPPPCGYLALCLQYATVKVIQSAHLLENEAAKEVKDATHKMFVFKQQLENTFLILIIGVKNMYLTTLC